MKYLYVDPNNGILEKKSVQELKDELESDKILAQESAEMAREQENEDMIEWNENVIFEFYEDEHDFYKELTTMRNNSHESFIAAKVSNKMYEKIKSEFGVCPF